MAVFPGELIAVAGPSGSDKKTLLHLLAAIDSSTSGEVLIEGTAMSGLTRKQQAETRLGRLGFLFSEHIRGADVYCNGRAPAGLERLILTRSPCMRVLRAAS